MRDKVYIGSFGSRILWWIGTHPVATFCLVTLNLMSYFGLVIILGSLTGESRDLAIGLGIIPNNLHLMSFLTSLFLHLDPVHLLVNMLFLWLFGRKLERAIGTIPFLLFYIGSGIIASLLHVAIAFLTLSPVLQGNPIVGASGAISGVLGMFAIQFRFDKINIGRINIPTVFLLLGWLLFQAGLGIAGLFMSRLGPFDLQFVGYWSHIGGFIFGMAAAWLISSIRGGAMLDRQAREILELRKQALLDVAHCYRELTSFDPCDPFAFAELARTLALLEDKEPSLTNYLEAVKLYCKEGKRDEAMSSLREAFQFWPDSDIEPAAALQFACCLELLDEHDEAAGRFSRIASEAHGKPEEEKALFMLGQIELDKLKRPDRAIEALERLLKEYPDSKMADNAKQLLERAMSELVRDRSEQAS